MLISIQHFVQHEPDCRCASLRASLRAWAWHLNFGRRVEVGCIPSITQDHSISLDHSGIPTIPRCFWMCPVRFEKLIHKWKANIKVQVVQARAAASVAAFFMASSLRSCAKKSFWDEHAFKLKNNKKYAMTSFKPMKSRDCVDYMEIQ